MNDAIVRKKKTARVPRLAAYYVAIAVDIILLYVLNNLIYMNIAVLNTGRFVSCLWAINLVLTVGIIGNFSLLLYRPLWYYHFTHTISNFLVVVAFFVIYRWFPFDVSSDSAQRIIKIVLIIGMAGTALGGLIELVKFLIAFFIREKPPVLPAVQFTSVAPEFDTWLNPSYALPAGAVGVVPEQTPQPESPESQRPTETPPSVPPPSNSEAGTAASPETPSSQAGPVPPESIPPASSEPPSSRS